MRVPALAVIGRRQLPVYSPLTLGAVVASASRGDERGRLAAALRQEYDATEVQLTSSGTAALTLALQLARRRRPDAPCLLPAFACFDLVTAAVGAGVPVALYDIDPATLAPDPGSLERLAARGAAALVVVHLFGVPVAMDAMRAAASKAGALLIEDAAQGTGGLWSGRPLGASGDLGILSFGRGKGQTGGGGGALLIRESADLPEPPAWPPDGPAGRSIAFTARLLAQWSFGRPLLYSIPASIPMLRLGETVYREPAPPAGMSAATARVLSLTRALGRDEAATRLKHASRWLRALGAQGAARSVSPHSNAEPGWLRFPLRLSSEEQLAPAVRHLGVARSYPRALHEVDALAPLLRPTGGLPGAEALARRLCTVPTHSRLSERDLDRLEHWLAGLGTLR